MSENQSPYTLKDHLSGRGLYRLSQMVLKTCNFQIQHLDRLVESVSSDRPVIYTGWHGITMMAVPLIQQYHGDLRNFVVLMPDDWRGTSLKIWAEKMGATPHPMNLTGDSTLGMAKQVLRLTKRVVAGKCLYINPDGPDGPAHVIKPGITYIARKANAVILPIGAYARHAYIVPRWDRYAIPYPFARISYHIGEPIKELPEDEDAAAKLVTDRINAVTLQAAADYYEKA
ncbi:MAG: lysophospholipid acyltransferase family protein [Anaerolineales bacterium]